jgi:hypothetical protein
VNDLVSAAKVFALTAMDLCNQERGPEEARRP